MGEVISFPGNDDFEENEFKKILEKIDVPPGEFKDCIVENLSSFIKNGDRFIFT